MSIEFFPSAIQFPHLAQEATVAILTRTKDRPVLLARALASVLSQEYEHWHLYLVNDGGNASTVDQICNQYFTAFKGRLTVIHHEYSMGMEAASNSALSKTHAELVSVHDDDDSWHPAFLRRTVEHLSAPQNSRQAAVVTNLIVINERIEGDQVIEINQTPWAYWKPSIDLKNMLSSNGFPPISLVIRRAVFDLVGQFNPHLPVLGDWDFHLRALTVADIGTIDEPLAYYHHRIENTNSAYGNSVTAGIDRHMAYDVMYRNSMVRQLLQKDPAYAGLLHVLLRANEELIKRQTEMLDRNAAWGHQRHLDLQGRIDAVQQQVNMVQTQVTSGLRPLRRIWKKVLPLRNMIARLRGAT
jgi:glycosyltransferase involved in cell wall biosynthesis